MFQTFKNAWKVQDLRKKLLFTLMILLLYRIGANLFVPFVNTTLISSQTDQLMNQGILGLINLFSGGALGQATFFALSVSPYITASIVMQLVTIAIPKLEKLSKDEEGRKKINAATRWVTVALALVTAIGYVNLLNNHELTLIQWKAIKGADDVYTNTLTGEASTFGAYFFQVVVMVACFCAGAALIMWLAEKINDFGIGNGISLILFANIISRAGQLFTTMLDWILVAPLFAEGKTVGGYIEGSLEFVLGIALVIFVIGFMVWFTNSERRIKVIYAKKVVGRKMFGGQKTNLPLKMNMAGVMPVIFGSSIVSILPTIAQLVPADSGFAKFVNNWFGSNTPIYVFLYLVLIFLFSYFYIAISFNPVEVSNNIRSNGGAIVGIRPQEMAPYIKKILNRVTLMGAVFLALIAGLPLVIGAVYYAFTGTQSVYLSFFGTSLLILVGVALETVQDLEAQLSMRNYKGFLD